MNPPDNLGTARSFCAAFWRKKPIFTLAFLAVTLPLALSFFVSCLALTRSFTCFLQEWCALYPERIYQRGEVWRLVTPHFVPGTLWQGLFTATAIVPAAYMLEQSMGSGKYVLLLALCLLCSSLFASALAAIVHFTPGLRNWSYFDAQWYSVSDLGPTTVLMATTILSFRHRGTKAAPFCCCMLPCWSIILVTCLLAQLMMYPPWYGIFYNAGAVIGAYSIPRRYVRAQPAPEASVDGGAAPTLAKPAAGEPLDPPAPDAVPRAAVKQQADVHELVGGRQL